MIQSITCTGSIINETAGKIEIRIFDIPEDGFQLISKEYLNIDCPPVLFLDINMPTRSGWEFPEKFETLDKNIKRQIKIYMLSSSVDASDRQRAK